jgi:hypothetical protein
MLLMLLCRLDSWLVDMKHHLSHNHIIFGSDLNHRPFGFAQGRYFCDRHGGNTYRRLEWREVGGDTQGRESMRHSFGSASAITHCQSTYFALSKQSSHKRKFNTSQVQNTMHFRKTDPVVSRYSSANLPICAM